MDMFFKINSKNRFKEFLYIYTKNIIEETVLLK